MAQTSRWRTEDEFGVGGIIYPTTLGISIETLPNKLIPPPGADSRKSPLPAGVFNIIATLIDGTALSLPFAIARCGIGVGVGVVLLTYMTTLVSCRLIVIMARKLGAGSLSEIVETLLGSVMRQVFSWNLALILLCILTGFMILVKDIMKDIWHYFLPDQSLPVYTTLTIVAVATLPLTTQDTLHALRHSCYCGFASICVLLGCLMYKAAVHVFQDPEKMWNIRFGPESWIDVLTALPIVKVCYLCQFNMLGVYGNLSDPTPERIDFTVRIALRIITAFFIIFSVTGYVIFVVEFEGKAVDNILSPYPVDDSLLLVGRCSLTLALLAALPVVMVPCRTIMLNEIVSWMSSTRISREITPGLLSPNNARAKANLLRETQQKYRRTKQSLSRRNREESQQHEYGGHNWLGEVPVRVSLTPAREPDSDDETITPSPGNSSPVSTNGDTNGNTVSTDDSGDTNSRRSSDETWLGCSYMMGRAELRLLRHLTDDADVGLEGLEPMWQAWRTRHAESVAQGIGQLDSPLSSGVEDGGVVHFRRVRNEHDNAGERAHDLQPGEKTPLLSRTEARAGMNSMQSGTTVGERAVDMTGGVSSRQASANESLLSQCDEFGILETPLPLVIYSSVISKVVLTIILNVVIIVVAVETPQVSMVWTLAGSTVSLFVAFVVPCICFIVFCESKNLTGEPSQSAAWLLLIYGFAVMGMCTLHNVRRIYDLDKGPTY